MCSKHADHSKLKSQHGWGDLYDHLMSKKIYIFMIHKIFVQDPKLMMQTTIGTIWIS